MNEHATILILCAAEASILFTLMLVFFTRSSFGNRQLRSGLVSKRAVKAGFRQEQNLDQAAWFGQCMNLFAISSIDFLQQGMDADGFVGTSPGAEKHRSEPLPAVCPPGETGLLPRRRQGAHSNVLPFELTAEALDRLLSRRSGEDCSGSIDNVVVLDHYRRANLD